jgi:hypothetical protein
MPGLCGGKRSVNRAAPTESCTPIRARPKPAPRADTRLGRWRQIERVRRVDDVHLWSTLPAGAALRDFISCSTCCDVVHLAPRRILGRLSAWDKDRRRAAKVNTPNMVVGTEVGRSMGACTSKAYVEPVGPALSATQRSRKALASWAERFGLCEVGRGVSRRS